MSVVCFEGGQLTPSLALWRRSLMLPTWSSIWRGSSRGKWRTKDALQGSQPPFSPFARRTAKSILVTADPLNISSLNTSPPPHPSFSALWSHVVYWQPCCSLSSLTRLRTVRPEDQCLIPEGSRVCFCVHRIQSSCGFSTGIRLPGRKADHSRPSSDEG